MAYQNQHQSQNRVNINEKLEQRSFSQLIMLIDFKKPQIKIDEEEIFLFDEIAEEMAYRISKYDDGNKSSQLRKYYDEILMWDQKIQQDTNQYSEYLPLIKMLNAKVAYANGRGGKKPLVDKNFVDLIRHCLGQLKSPDNPKDAKSNKEAVKVFKNCKLFFEAFMGFYKVYRPQ